MDNRVMVTLIAVVVLGLFWGVASRSGKMDFSGPEIKTSNKETDEWYDLLDRRIEIMDYRLGQMSLKTKGFALDEFNIRKADKFDVVAGQAFYYSNKKRVVKFIFQGTKENGAVFKYESKTQIKEGKQTVVLIDQGIFLLEWK